MLRFLAVCLLALLNAQDAAKHKVKPYQDGEAYKVYSAVLALEKGKSEVLISDTTVPFNQCADSNSHKAVDVAIQDYKRTNKDHWLLGYQFDLKRPYKVLSANEVQQLLELDKSGKWRLSPYKGIHRFSAVGFNADKTIAFLEMDVICGGLCGHGEAFILEKKQGKWVKYSPPAPEPAQNPDGTFTVQGPTICSWFY
jgi:hypothetical protein